VSGIGTWFVWCRGVDAKPLPELQAILAASEIATRLDGASLVSEARTRDGEVEIVVTLVRAPHVVQEAAEFAERRARDNAEHDRYAAFDARYEMAWPLELEHVAFSFAMSIGTVVRDAVGGLLVDTTSGHIDGR